MWCKRTGRMLVGVEIGSTAVKLVALRQDADRFRVTGYACHPLPSGSVVDQRIQRVDEVAGALYSAIEQAGLGACRASVGVPASAAITKTLTFPASLDDDEVEARIELEFDTHIPFPFAEVAFDFQRLGPSRGRNDDQDVLLVACRQQDVDLLTAVLRQAGLQPVAVDVETFAIERAITHSQGRHSVTQDEVALVNVGNARSAFYVLSRGRIIYSSDIDVNGQQLQVGLPEESGHTALAPFVSALAQQVARSLQLHYTAGREIDVKRLILAGEAGYTPGLVEQLAEESGLVVSLANPFMQMTVAPQVDGQALTESAPTLLTACGLAMRAQR